MHYLQCIAMLEYLLQKLNAGQRVQVPVETVDEVQNVLIALNKKLERENNREITIRIRDIMEAAIEVRNATGLTFLTDDMKNAITSGIHELLSHIRILAFNYFKINDFEPTPEIIPIMRGVVEEALLKGVV